MKFTSTLVPLVALLSLAGAAHADNRGVTLVNDTSARVVAVYVSATGANSWRRDLLKGKPLSAGQSRAATIPGGKGVCAYDFRIELETSSGVRTLDRVQDLCALDVLMITP